MPAQDARTFVEKRAGPAGPGIRQSEAVCPDQVGARAILWRGVVKLRGSWLRPNQQPNLINLELNRVLPIAAMSNTFCT